MIDSVRPGGPRRGTGAEQPGGVPREEDGDRRERGGSMRGRARRRSSPWRAARIAGVVAGVAAAAWAAAGPAHAAGPSLAAGEALTLAGQDFAAGTVGWQQSASTGGAPFTADTAGGRTTVVCDLPGGATATLSRAWSVGAADLELPSGAAHGRRLVAEVDVRLDGAAAGGQGEALHLRVFAESGSGDRLIATSTIDVADAPRARWFRWSTGLATDALRSDTSALRVEWTVAASGVVRVDTLRVRYEAPERAPDFGGGFESADPTWSHDDWSDVPASDAAIGGYRGAGYARLDWNDAYLTRDVAVSALAPLCAGVPVEAGAWLRVDDAAAVGAAPSWSDEVVISVVARDEADDWSETIAEGAFRPRVADRGDWVYLETTPVGDGRIPARATELRVRLTSTVEGEVRVDEVELGAAHALDGNPARMVGVNYVGRYRSPHYPLGGGDLLEPQQTWRNWRWTTPPAPDAGFTGFAHDPDCATSPTCVRPNGRRDVAVGTEGSPNDVPLVGAYDSRDADVLAYHLELAQAIGIDFLVYEYLGHALATQHAQFGHEPINEECFEALLAQLEDPRFDVKLAVMYEPKVHMQGWVADQPTLHEKKLGMATDLAYLVERYEGARGVLKRDGRPVVFLFRDRSCDPTGTQCLDAADWVDVLEWVQADTGVAPYVVADAVPEPDAPFDGVSRWDLVSRAFLKYRTFDDAVSGTPTAPRPDPAALAQHCGDRHRVGRDWAREAPADRLHVPIVWPGFDDTGVAGWGLPNVTGEDGTPLGVRVADTLDGRFYRTTVTSALASDARWIQIATWNDWNENTRIEPAWDPAFVPSEFSEHWLDARVQRQVFGRALETQAWVAGFKGVEAQPDLLPRIAMRYLERAASDPAVTQYD